MPCFTVDISHISLVCVQGLLNVQWNLVTTNIYKNIDCTTLYYDPQESCDL